jgi:inosine-uridine nucleoside N-ribohydrolase
MEGIVQRFSSSKYSHVFSDGLSNITQRHPELSPDAGFDVSEYLEISTEPGTDVATDILRSHPSRSITYIALGPLTNLALMMRKESQLIIERIGCVVSMGGALDVPGNTSPVAECESKLD